MGKAGLDRTPGVMTGLYGIIPTLGVLGWACITAAVLAVAPRSQPRLVAV